jgi:predicted metal-binding protein
MPEVATTFLQYAVDAGATHALILETAALRAEESVREACLANACGKSGRNWTCPPRVGELAELDARLRAYPHGVLIQNIYPLEDSWDFEGMADAAHAHNVIIRTVSAQIAATGAEVLPLACGGCDYCEKCSCPDAPCRFPEHALASVEGYGLDVRALVEDRGLHYINGVNTVSYVGMVLYR